MALAMISFGAPVGVDVGGVPGGEGDVVGVFKEGEGMSFLEDPFLPGGGAVGHGTEDYFGDFEAGGTEALGVGY